MKPFISIVFLSLLALVPAGPAQADFTVNVNILQGTIDPGDGEGYVTLKNASGTPIYGGGTASFSRTISPGTLVVPELILYGMTIEVSANDIQVGQNLHANHFYRRASQASVAKFRNSSPFSSIDPSFSGSDGDVFDLNYTFDPADSLTDIRYVDYFLLGAPPTGTPSVRYDLSGSPTLNPWEINWSTLQSLGFGESTGNLALVKVTDFNGREKTSDPFFFDINSPSSNSAVPEPSFMAISSIFIAAGIWRAKRRQRKTGGFPPIETP